MNDVDYLSHVVVKHIDHVYHACCLRCGYKSFNSDSEMLKQALQGHSCNKERIGEEPQPEKPHVSSQA